MDFKTRFNGWQRSQELKEYERNRTAYLTSAPLPKNDPRLFEKIKVRIIKPFYNDGVLQTPEMGIVLIARHVAEDMKALKKVQILNES